jgi:hypothetical protein
MNVHTLAGIALILVGAFGLAISGFNSSAAYRGVSPDLLAMSAHDSHQVDVALRSGLGLVVVSGMLLTWRGKK